jgi:hypothetical protein
MRKSVLLLAAAALVFPVSEARAQQWLQRWQPFDGKLLVNVNLGIQVGDNELSRQETRSVYDETAQIDISQTINNGFFFEIGAASRVQRVHKDFGVGFVWSILSNPGDGSVSGTWPHPQFFDQTRSFNATAGDLKHTENAFHFQALWFYPFTDKVDFTFSFGPSIFRVTQGLIRDVVISEVGPPFTSVNVDSVDVIELSDSGWGFNMGADMIYALRPGIDVGALIRYTHGNVEFNVSNSQTSDVTAGGFQLGAGVRLKF